MKKYNIPIFTGGGFTKTLVIESHRYVISDGMIKFFNNNDEITHCYPASITSFTVEYDEYEFN